MWPVSFILFTDPNARETGAASNVMDLRDPSDVHSGNLCSRKFGIGCPVALA